MDYKQLKKLVGIKLNARLKANHNNLSFNSSPSEISKYWSEIDRTTAELDQVLNLCTKSGFKDLEEYALNNLHKGVTL
jgi:hypothetical protein